VVRCDEWELPLHVRQGILSCAEAAGPLLFELVDDLAVWATPAVHHIVTLLGELRYEPSIHFLVDLLWDEPDLTEAHDALLLFGEPAIPFLLLNVHKFPEDLLPTVTEIAAGKGRADVRGAFESLLGEGAAVAATFAHMLDDPALVPALLHALEALDDTDPDNRQHIIDLTDAIEHLGGDLGDLARKEENVRIANARRLAQMAPGARRPRRRRKR